MANPIAVAPYALEGPLEMWQLEWRFEGLEVHQVITRLENEALLTTVDAKLDNGVWVRETWSEVGFNKCKWLVWVEEI